MKEELEKVYVMCHLLAKFRFINRLCSLVINIYISERE